MSSPWRVVEQPEAPPQTWVVLALDGDEAGCVADLAAHGPPPAVQIVLVCCARFAPVASSQRWLTIIPIPETGETTPAEARRLGLAHASGHIVRIRAAGESPERSGARLAGGWASLLTEAGVDHPGRSGEQAQ
jgi:hypothetical protein